MICFKHSMPSRVKGKHAVSAAGRAIRGVELRRSVSGGAFVSDDLFQVFDAVSGEGDHTIFADTIDAKAAVPGLRRGRLRETVGSFSS